MRHVLKHALKNEHTNSLILNDQVRQLIAALPFAVGASLVNGMILVFIMRNTVSDTILLYWVLSLILVSLCRVSLYYFYSQSKPWPSTDYRWWSLNWIGVLLSSCVWGSASHFLFIPDSIAHQAFLGFIIAGTTAGGISTLSFAKSTVLIFLVFTLIPLILNFFFIGSETGIAMGSMVLLYALVMISVAIKSYHHNYQNIKLRLDIEEQKKALQQSEEKYQSIFQSAPLGILHYTSQGDVSSYNHMMVDLFDLETETFNSVNLLAIQDDEFVMAIKSSLNGAPGQYKGSTDILFGKNHKPIRMYCRGTFDSAKRITGGVAIFEDITEDKLVNQLKNEFVSTVSHELRTPLTAIFGSAELLSNAKEKMTEEQYHLLVENISRNADRLIQLVNDILDVEKISAGKMTFNLKEWDLTELLNHAVSDNKSYAEKYKVKYVLDEDIELTTLMVDQNRFQQVMANLLSNAAKFSPPESLVHVGAKRRGDVVRVYVKDRGPGIPIEFQDKIFEKFTQSDASDTRQVGGTGLGLNISKAMIEKMNGVLDFETEVGKGSTFYFELPWV